MSIENSEVTVADRTLRGLASVRMARDPNLKVKDMFAEVVVPSKVDLGCI